MCIMCQILSGTNIFLDQKKLKQYLFFLLQWLEFPNHWDKNIFNLDNFSSAVVSRESDNYFILETQKF